MHNNTERPSTYSNIEKMSTDEIVKCINQEDKRVAIEIEKQLQEIAQVIDIIVKQIKTGGRLLYIGAGTSGRLGILDASECPPTFGVAADTVTGIIAGGTTAITKAVEHAEDKKEQGWKDLVAHAVTELDFVIGISASGTTPYVVGALQYCNKNNIKNGCITSYADSPIANEATYPICINTGPEFISGSTRMKAGTATKLVLNMISTGVMIKLGHIEDNKMIDMQLTNNKLIERGTKIIMQKLDIGYNEAKELLIKNGSVRKAFNKK